MNFFTGCLAALSAVSSSVTSGATEAPLPSSLEAVYSRTTNFFSDTTLFKPAETEAPSPFFSFAPLLLQELRPEQSITKPADRFGTLVLSNNLVCLDFIHPAIYAAVDAVELTPGSSHPRFTYIWCYAGPGNRGGTKPSLSMQGIRVVLDGEGRPAIWEILADTTGKQVFFVSQSLQAAAAARYGKVLDGRRYAIERSMAEASNVVVARVLDDGPVPMGPIVYLVADSHDVSTVICRCMPAQARRVAEARTYELLSISEHEAVLAAVLEQGKLKRAFWPRGPRTRLSELLRLP